MWSVFCDSDPRSRIEATAVQLTKARNSVIPYARWNRKLRWIYEVRGDTRHVIHSEEAEWSIKMREPSWGEKKRTEKKWLGKKLMGGRVGWRGVRMCVCVYVCSGGWNHSQSPPVCRDKHREGPTARTGAYGRAWLTVLTFRKSEVNKVSQRINSSGSRVANTHTHTH